MAVQKVVIEIVGDTKGIDSTIKQLEKVGKVDRKNAKSFKQTSGAMSKGFGQLKTKVMALGATMLGAFAIQQVIGNAIGNIKKFESSLDNLQAITGATSDTMDFLTKKALEIGATSTKSAIEAVEAFKLMASAKPELLENAEALAEVTQQAIILSEASGQSLPEAIKNLGDTLNAMDLPASDAARVVNVLAAASQKGAREVPFLTAALSKFGGVAASAGVSVEESAAAIEILGAKIPQAETVGVGLRNVLLELQTAAQAQGREFLGLGEELELLAPKINDITFLEKSFGKENILVAQTLIKQRDQLKNMTEDITGTNTAMEQAITNTDNLEGSLARVGNAWENFTLSLSGSKGFMKDAVDGLTTLLLAMSEQGDILEDLIELQGGAFAKSVQDVFEVYRDFGQRVQALKDLQEGGIKTMKRQIDIQTKLIEKLEEHGASDEELFDAEVNLAQATIDLEKAMEDLTKAQTPLFRSQEELDAIFNKNAGTIDNAASSFKELKKNVADALLVIKNQAAEGGVTTAAVTLYKLAVRELEQAQLAVDKAIGKANKAIKEQKIALSDIPIEISPEEDVIGEELAERERLQKIDFLNELLSIQRVANADLEQLERDFGMEIEAIRDAANDSGLQDLSDYIDDQIDLDKKLTEDKKKQLDDQLQNAKDALDQQEQLREVEMQQVRAVANLYVQMEQRKLNEIQSSFNKQMEIIDLKMEREIISEEEGNKAKKDLENKYNQERNEIIRNQEIAKRASAIFEATINTAVAYTNALKTDIRLAQAVAALGILQIAAIAAAPMPTYHEGEVDIQNPKDEFQAKLKRGESVIRPEATAMYKEELQAANEFKLKELILKKYVIPALNINSSSSGAMVGGGISMFNLEKQMRKSHKLTTYTNYLLEKMQQNPNLRRTYN